MQWKLCFAQRLNRLGGCYNLWLYESSDNSYQFNLVELLEVQIYSSHQEYTSFYTIGEF